MTLSRYLAFDRLFVVMTRYLIHSPYHILYDIVFILIPTELYATNHITISIPSNITIYHWRVPSFLYSVVLSSQDLVEEGFHIITQKATLALDLVIDLQHLLLVVTHWSGQLEGTQEPPCFVEVATNLVYLMGQVV